MKLTFLGTGTSQGIPVIGCDCEVCHSDNPQDNRTRVSVMVENEGTCIVVDVGPDFRQQMLRTKTRKIDAVLITHEHNDHVIGLDDLRPFNFRQGFDMPIFTSIRVLEDLKQRFAYTFAERLYPGAPRFDWRLIDENSHFKIQHIDIQCIGIMHGELPILGFRFGDIAYCTDVKSIAQSELEKLKNLEVLILSALHHENHHSHLSLMQALDLVKVIQPKRTLLTHMSHNLGKAVDINAQLPPNIQFAYDGLEIFV
ncbi:MAG: MBL fold metallo-hydrolase [Bacteroidia bacterium]